MDAITAGSQKWHGAAPSFSIRATARIFTIHIEGAQELHMYILAINIIADPMACARKYFTAPSVSWLVLVEHINGINLNRLISMAIHAVIQLVLDNAIKVLRTIVVIARIDVGVH
jgi:hypothetical protein